MSCPKCAELQAQLAEAREENAEHMNDAVQDGQAVKRFMDLNKSLTERVLQLSTALRCLMAEPNSFVAIGKAHEALAGEATAQVCMEHGYIREGRDCKKCESATQDKYIEGCEDCGATRPREWVLKLRESEQGHGYYERTFDGPSIGSQPITVIEKATQDKCPTCQGSRQFASFTAEPVPCPTCSTSNDKSGGKND